MSGDGMSRIGTSRTGTFDWSAEAIESLTRMVAQGATGQAMADILGITRNAAIGKAHRLGLRVRGGEKGRVAAPRVPKAKPSLPCNLRASLAAEPPQDEPVPNASAGTALIQIIAVEFMQLGPHMCRWPLGGHQERAPYMFCGAVAPGVQSYCPYHARLSVNPGARVLAHYTAWGRR